MVENNDTPPPQPQMIGGSASEFYLNSGEKIVVDRGFMVSIANLLEHGAFDKNTTDADTAVEYANELYRVLFAQRDSEPVKTPAALSAEVEG